MTLGFSSLSSLSDLQASCLHSNQAPSMLQRISALSLLNMFINKSSKERNDDIQHLLKRQKYLHSLYLFITNKVLNWKRVDLDWI